MYGNGYREPFIRRCHADTGGWIPLNPLTQHVKPGDFCQIRDGALRVLGNIRMLGMPDEEAQPRERELTLAGSEWNLGCGVRQVFCAGEHTSNDHGARAEMQRRILEFDGRGSFLFSGRAPKCRMLTNWSAFEIDITVKLTQAMFAFRDVHVVTQSLSLEDWALAIAGSAQARLELVGHAETDQAPFWSHGTKVLQSQDIALLAHSADNKARFFKARKLVLRQARREFYVERLFSARRALGERDIGNWLEADLLNLVEANELNVATCLEFFEWADTGLEDALRLC